MFLTRDKDLSFATIPFAKIPSNARLCFEHERKAARPWAHHVDSIIQREALLDRPKITGVVNLSNRTARPCRKFAKRGARIAERNTLRVKV